MSKAEAEYIVVGSCCAQNLWIKMQLKDNDIKQRKITIKCDNISIINLSKNPIQYSTSKYIKIRYHFIRKHVANDDINLEYVNIENQLADIFIKSLKGDRFCSLRRELGVFAIEC